MRIRIKGGSPSNITGMGPSAWDRDTQKMSIHPHLPGHAEHEEHEAEKHHHTNPHHRKKSGISTKDD